MQAFAVSFAMTQIDQEKATGTVIADFDEHGEAAYDIVQDIAWDYIQPLPEHKELIQNSEAFVFGSLITRSEASQNTLLELLEYSKFKVFDVNFRPPFIDFEFIKKLTKSSLFSPASFFIFSLLISLHISLPLPL